MAEIIIIICFFLIIILIMELRNLRLKKDIYTFTEQLELYLDHMLDGKDIEPPANSQDTLWNKINEKLLQLNHIWIRKNDENMEEKERIKELISDISHQTKTPIANMKLYLEMLKDTSLPNSSQSFLTNLESQTEKLDFLLQSMVKMSRLEAGIIEIHQQRANLYETLLHAVSSIVPKAEKKQIQLFVECDENIAVNHDSKWTEEAIFNILDNAVKYTKAGGTIRIHVNVQEFFTKISIKDSGKGIALKRQAQIFTRFYREPEVYSCEGIGIGLYLSRQILTLQKGYIEVHSQVGQGSDFQIYLPNEQL